MRWIPTIVLAIACVCLPQHAQATPYPFSPEFWQVEAVESAFVSHLGQQALRLKGGEAILRDLELTDGVIEFDIAVGEARGFAGCVFRRLDANSFEHFYIRPHQSGQADANQYTPVFNGVSAWQLYYGEAYAAPVKYRYNEWMHVKVAFQGSHAEVFIDSDAPMLLVDSLMRPRAAGGVGFNVGNFAAAYFANFEASPLPEGYSVARSRRASAPAKEGIVASWMVSDTFDGADLQGLTRLDKGLTAARKWTRLAADTDGKTNLAKVQGLSEKKNTAFARLRVRSDKAQVKGVSFGYSDGVSVFANDRLLYSGSNEYLSRDHRYLGTIGLFDKVYLPLEAGDNEILFAVTEVFGGWGIQAQFDDLKGISLDHRR